MDTDLFLVIGTIIFVLAIPSVVSAYSDSRPPRVAAILVLIGGGLLVAAVTQRPGGYTINDVPTAFINVIGRFI